MDFIANIIPGAEGASGSKPKAAAKADKAHGDESPSFAALVSKNDTEAPPAPPRTEVEPQEGLIPAALVMPAQGAGEGGLANKSENSAVAQIAAGELKPALNLKGGNDPAGTAATKEGGVILARQQAAVNMSGQDNPSGAFAVPKTDNPVQSGVLAAKDGGTKTDSLLTTGNRLKDGIAGLPDGISLAKTGSEKPPLTKTGPAAKTDPNMKASPDMADPANQALAAFARMSRGGAAKAAPELVAARIDGGDGAKTVEARAPSVSFETTLNISADRPQTAQTLPPVHPADAKPGALPVNSVAVEIARKFSAGANRFRIRLDPPELGRIDVRMDVNKEGHVRAHLVVEKPETLIALNRDAASLERALNASGLEMKQNGLNFSLSGGNQDFDDQGKTAGPGAVDDMDIPGGHEIETFNADKVRRGYISASGVDIHV